MSSAAGEYQRARQALLGVRRVQGGAPLALSLYKALEDNDLGTLVALSGAAEQLLEVKAVAFDERLHPRDAHGEFAHKRGGMVRPAILVQVAENRAKPGGGDQYTRYTSPIEGETGWADALKTMADRRGMSVSEYLKATRKRVAWLTAPGRAHVAVRIDHRILPMALERGEIVSATDPAHVHAEGGKLEPKDAPYVADRRAWEQRVFGGHPVYGYLAEDDEAVSAQAVDAWGDVKLSLKDNVRDRSTFVYSDSNYIGVGRPTSGAAPMALNDRAEHIPLEMAVVPFMDVLNVTRLTHDGGAENPAPPLPADLKREKDRLERIKAGKDEVAKWSPGWAEQEKRLDERIRNWLYDQEDSGKWKRWNHGDFFETQIHGGVRVEDIDHITFTQPPDAATAERLDKLQIPWRVEPASEQKSFDERLHPRDAHGEFAHKPGARNLAASFKLPKSGKMRALAEETLPIVDRLLAYPALETPIPVRATRGKNTLGGFARRTVTSADGTRRLLPDSIQVSTNDNPHLTLIHEAAGHMLDEQLGEPIEYRGTHRNVYGSVLAAVRAGSGNVRGSQELNLGRRRNEYDVQAEVELERLAGSAQHQPEWDAWWQAVRDSPEYQALAAGPSPRTRKYLRTPAEAFARCMTQWVATRSQDAGLAEELHQERDPEAIAAHMDPIEPRTLQETLDWHKRGWPVHGRPAMAEDVPDYLRLRQWSDENFAPIGDALDRLLEAYDIRR